VANSSRPPGGIQKAREELYTFVWCARNESNEKKAAAERLMLLISRIQEGVLRAIAEGTKFHANGSKREGKIIPRAAAEHRSWNRGRRETFDRARGATIRQDERAQRAGLHFCARRVRRAPGCSEARREPRGVYAAKRPGRISFGDFSLSVQRKVTCRGSATHK